VICSGTIYVSDTSKVKFEQGAALGQSISYWYDDWSTGASYLKTLSAENSDDLTILANMGIGGEEYINNTTAYLMDLNGTTSADGLSWNVDIPDQLGSVALRGNITVETAESLKSDYVYTTENSGNMPSDKNIGDVISAEEMFNNSIAGSYSSKKASLTVKGVAADLKPSTAKDGTVTDDSKYNSGKTYTGKIISATDGTFNNDSGCYEFKLNCGDFANDSSTYYIDATQGNVQVQLTGSSDSASPKFVIVGSNSVIFTIADSAGSVGLKEPMFVTAQIYDMLNSNATFYLGDEPSVEGSPAAPNIYFYVGKDSTFECRNSSSAFWSAYMYGPEAYFNANTNHGKPINYSYNGSPVMSQSSISVLGSMVFKTIYSQNEFGIGYIKPDGGGSTTPTGTLITWDRQRYLSR
jgi:hypothetical protein